MRSRFIEMFEKEKYPVVNLEELIDKNIETAKKDFSKESIIKYIDISSIDNVNHRIIGYNEFVLSDAPSRAQQHIRFNDILVSTVRPNLKNVARVELKDSNLVASSGFCVLRPKKCSSEYLLSIVKSYKFTLDMSQAVSGATYPAIKDSDIYNYKIKYPPKEIQNAFSLFVKQLDKSKFLLQQMIEKLELLKKSRFIEMFKNSQKVNLKDVSEITMGQSPDSITYNTEKDGLPFFQGKTEFKEKYIGTPSVWCNAPKKIANSNDILMSVRAPVGDVNITLEKCCIGRGLASIRAKNISTEYLFFALSLLKDEIESKGVGSTFKAINKDIIESIQIPSVDKKLQNDFSEFFIQIDKSKFWTKILG